MAAPAGWRQFSAHQVGRWSPTIAQVRDVILAGTISGGLDMSDFVAMRPEAEQFRSNPAEVQQVAALAKEAVLAGRLIDFGWVPNRVIQFGGRRGGNLWDAGGLTMPFSDPWVFRHEWESGVAVYLVNPIVAGGGGMLPHPITGELVETEEGFECAELNAYTLAGVGRYLSLDDRGRVFKAVAGMPTDKLWAQVAPAYGRFFADPELFDRCNQGQSPIEAAAGNIADPVATALLMLGTRNVERETVRAPEKLQRARIKGGKAPIPPHDVVHSAAYVTAVQGRGVRRERGEDHGGTHRSPIAHIRMGHPREYATGRTIFIKDTLVNVPEDQRTAFKAQRSHYDAGRLNRPGL